MQSFNLHALLHVYEDCRKHGPLSSYSAFNFETFNMKFYRYIKARKKPITEFANRYHETVNTSFFLDRKVKVSTNNFIIGNTLIMKSDTSPDQVFTGAQPLFVQPCDSRMISILKFQIANAVNYDNYNVVNGIECIIVKNLDEIICLPVNHY